MAFESLTDKLQNVFKNLRSKGRLTEGQSDRTGCSDWFKSRSDGNKDCKRRDGIPDGFRDDRAGD